MNTGTYEQTFEFSLYGIHVPSTIIFNVPTLQLTAQLEAGSALRLKVHVKDTFEDEAERKANNFAQELYRRLLLQFASDIERSEPPRSIHRTFTTIGTSPVIITQQTITGKASIIRPNKVLLKPEIDAFVRDVEMRVITQQPATSAQLYTATAMYANGMESQNKVIRFLVFYSALALAALFKWHDGKQNNVDRLLLEANPRLSKLPHPKKTNVEETLYTKLRNDLIHAEDRGCDPITAIAAINQNIPQFQHDVSFVFSSL